MTGEIDPKGAAVHTFKGRGGSNWEIWPPEKSDVKKVPLPWSSFVTPVAVHDTTFGYKWAKGVAKGDAVVTLPEYYRMEMDAEDKERWAVVVAEDVPAETGLASSSSRSGSAPTGRLTSPRARRTVAGRSRGRRPGRSRRSWVMAAC